MKRLAGLFFLLLMGLPLVGAVTSCTYTDDHLTMVAGSQRTVAITWKNNTSETWNPAGNYWAGSQEPQDNQVWGVARVVLPSTVNPGNSVLVNIPLTAPTTPGHYAARFGIVHENVNWLAETNCGPFDVNVVSPNLSIVNLHAVKNPTTALPDAARFTIVVKNTGSTDLTIESTKVAMVTLWGRLEKDSVLVPLGSKSLTDTGPWVKGGEQSFDLDVDDFSAFVDHTAVVEARLTTDEDSLTGMSLPVVVPGLLAGETASEDVAGNDWRTFVFVKKGNVIPVDDSNPLAVVMVGLAAGAALLMRKDRAEKTRARSR